MVMAKFTVDTAAKLFIAKPGVTEFDVKVDLYSDAKEHWIYDDNDRKFTFPFIDPSSGLTTAQGGPDIDPIAGTSIPTYVYLENGWRVRPDEANHTLIVTGGVLLVQGGGDPFADTVGLYRVNVRYQQPVQAIGVSTGAVVAPTQQQIRDALLLSPSGAGAPDSIDGQLVTILAEATVLIAFTYNENTNTVVLQAWLQRYGATTIPTSMSFILRTVGGTVVFSITDVDATVDAQGVYSATVAPVILQRPYTYYATVAVTDADGTVSTVKGIYTT